ncbi:cell division control protein 42 [Mycena sanguinolenta]|nr:cell division control protein 42 [Mycena sanguinolenta]
MPLRPHFSMNLRHGTCKLVVIGDGAVGKTCLLTALAFQTFPGPNSYLPPTFQSYVIDISVGADTYAVGLFDTAGQAEYDRLRPLSYAQTDVFVVCFGVGMSPSFENVKGKWFPEAHHHCPGFPCVFVATQIDLRTDQEELEKMARQGYLPFSTAQGQRMTRQVGAGRYLECSAKTREGVQTVFDEATAAAVASARTSTAKRNRKCIVL